MKSVVIYVLGIILMSPCILLASDSLIGASIALIWGVVLYHSPKFCRQFKKFWRLFYRANFKLIDAVA